MKYLEKFPEKRKGFELEELAEAILIFLWNRSKIIFHDGIMDLYSDLEYLKALNVISIQKSERIEETKIKIVDEEKLRKIAIDTKEFSERSTSDLLKEYIRRIDYAFSVTE
jgi:hypothetical protein